MIVSLISISYLSLLVYKTAIDFCALILYPASLPNSLMSSSSFLVATLEFSMHSIMSSANSNTFMSFPIWIHIIFFFLHWLPWLLLLLSRFSHVRLCVTQDGSPPGSPVPGILQARTLEWVAISFSVCVFNILQKLKDFFCISHYSPQYHLFT